MSEYTDDTPRFLTGNRSKPFPTDDDLLTDNVTYPEVPPSAQPGLDTNSPPKSFLTGRHAKLFPDQIQLPDHGFCESNNAPFVLTGARSKPFGRLSRSSSGKKSAFTLERPGSSHISLLHGNENEMNEDKPASPTGKHTKQIALVANSLFTTAEAPFSLAQEEQQDTSMPPDNDMQDPNSAFLNGGLAKLVSSSANTSSTTNTSLLPNNGVDDVNPAFLTGRHAKAFPKAPSIKNVAFTVERPEPSNPSLTPLNGKGSHVSAFTLERPGYPESDTSDDANPAFLTGKQAKPLPKSTSVKSVAFTLERPHRAQSSTLNDTNPAFLTGKHAKPFPRFSSSKSVAFVGDRPEPGENQLFPGDSGHETAFLTGKSAKAFPITADPFSLDTSPEQSSRHPHARESSDVRDGAPPPLFVAGTFARGISSGHSDGQSSNSPQITGHQRNKKEDSIARFHSEGQCARFALSNDDALEEGSLESYDSRQPLQGKSASHDNERPSFQPGTFARSFSPVAAGKLGQRLSSLAGATVQPSPTDGSEANGIQVYFTDQSAAEDSSSMSADFPQSEPGPPRARRHPSALGNSTPADPRASVHGSGYSLDSFRPTQNVTSMGRQRKSSRNAQQTTSISPSDGSSLSSFTSYLNIRFGREKAILSSSSGAPLTFRTHGFRKAFTPWLFRTVLSIKGMVLLLFMFTLLTCCLFLGYYKDMQDRRSIERLAHTILGTAALDVRNAISVEVQAIESYCRMNVDLYRAGHWTTATFVEPSALFWSSLRLFSFPTLWLGRNILAPPLYSGNILGAQHLEENLWLRWSEFNRTHTAADYFDEEGRFLYSDPPFNQEDQPWVTVHFALSREEQNIGHWTPLFAFHNALYQSYTVPIYAPDNETMEFVMGVDFTTDFLYALVDRSKENNPMHPDIVVMGMDGHVIATTFANAQVISMSPTGVPYTTAALDSPISLIRTAAKAVLEISPDNAYTSLTELRALHVSDEKHQSFFVTVVPYSSATGMRVIIFHILSHQVVFDPLKATLRNTALVVAGFVLTLTIVIMILLHYITQPLLDIKKAMNALFDESEINSTPYKRTYTKNSVAEVSSPGAAATAEMHDDPERGHGQPSLARSTRSAASSTRTLAERRNTSFVIKRLSRLSEISDLQVSFLKMKETIRAFGKFVPPVVVRRIIAREKRAGDLYVEKRRVAIFFSDVADFSSIAERMPSEVLISMLAQYFSEMSRAIEKSQGVLCDFIGDGLMAFWNAPQSVEDFATKALDCALEQQSRVEKLNASFRSQGWPEFHVRMGLHVGMAYAGNIGSRWRMKLGIVGDNVNLTSRLRALNKRYKSRLIVTGDCKSALSNSGFYLMRPLETVTVQGRPQSVDVYEVLGALHNVSAETREMVDDYSVVHQMVFAINPHRVNKNNKDVVAQACDSYNAKYPHDHAGRRLKEKVAKGTFGQPAALTESANL